jgi:hypothetical protein
MNRKRPCAPIVESKPGGDTGENKCRFCGRAYSRPDSLKRHQKKSCPILKKGGMEMLYDHVLKQSQTREQKMQTRIDELEAKRKSDKERLSQLEACLSALSTGNRGNVLVVNEGGNQQVNVHLDRRVFNYHVVINYFGNEDKSHITPGQIRKILDDSLRQSNLSDSALRAVYEAALLIYSDPDHPENITCYISNKRDGTAMIHGEKGWEIKPVPVVLPPMAKNSVDLIFDKQPEDKTYGGILKQILETEQELDSKNSGLRAVLIRNKNLRSVARGQSKLETVKTAET